VRQCPTRWGAFLDEAIRPAIRRVALHVSPYVQIGPDRNANLSSVTGPEGHEVVNLILTPPRPSAANAIVSIRNSV
jgi:hypothetical protein